MAKGKSTWKYNKLLTARRNYFAFGTSNMGNPMGIDFTSNAYHGYRGDAKATANFVKTANANGAGIDTNNLPGSLGGGSIKGPNIFQSAGSDIKGLFTDPGAALASPTMGMTSMLGAAAGAVGQIGGQLLSNGLESKAGGIVSGVGDALGAVPIVGGFAKGALNLVGGGINALFGSKLNQANINAANADINRMNNAAADAASFDALSQKMASTAGRTIHGKGFYGRDGVFSNKAGKIQREMEERARVASERQAIALLNNAEDLSANQLMGLEANYAAFGGPMNFGGGAIDFDFMNRYIMAKEAASQGKDGSMTSLPNSFADGGGIHIKPENKGKFTETKRRTGKTTEELTHSKNPLTRKRAIFAQNAKKWHHAFGGDLMTHGADFSNGMILIGNGGSHEENPFEGVPMGVDNEGTPNLVEEGETIFNDYVFSKRLNVPKAIREKYKLRGTKEMSFAEASKQLAKESEERPNDPISERGMQALMADLASAQESVKGEQQARQFAHGGRLFATGGSKGNQTLNYNNSTTGLYFGKDPSEFNPYASDGTIDWGIMYGANSPYTKRRQYVIDHWDDPGVQEWLGRYVEGINEYNKGRSGYQPMTKSDITKDIFTSRTWDKSWGGMHAGVDYAGDPERIIKTQHMLRGTDGLTAMPDDAIYYAGRNAQTGYTWDERFKDQYERLDNGAYTTEYDPETNTETRTYFYSPLEKKGSGNRYYKKNANGQYELVGGENPYLDIQNTGNYNQVRSVANDQDGTDYYYDPEEEDPEYKKLPTGLRYAPAVGLGIAALTDAFGLTNKPDYGNAEAVLEAAKGAGTYQPVRFNPIGNYLTYRPFDRDYYINKMNAEAGATRRSLLNTSGGNRGTAMAGILAADNNYLNQIGGLARQAEEYNLAQRQQVEDFNRNTNITNSQGFLQADIANQKALMDARESTLKGTMAAAEMRERARLASEQAKSSNLSGFITALGDIGRENMGWNWRNFGLATGTFGNVGDEERLLTHTGKKKSKGGKMKRRKGLTI